MAYLYRHIRLDTNMPFYIGIGIDANYYRANSKKSRNSYWKNIVSKSDYEVEILFEHDDYEFIKEKEVEFISLYGRSDLGLGTLCNLTNGGDGCTGLIHSDEARLKMGAPNKGKIISEEHRRKISEFHTGKIVSEETRRKMSKALSGENSPNYGKKDSYEAIQNKKKSAKKGESNKSCKLTEKEVLSIRELYLNGNYSQRKLASIFSISKTNIAMILNKKSWTHI